MLLIGGDKTGDDCWCESLVPVVDSLFEEYLNELTKLRELTQLQRSFQIEHRCGICVSTLGESVEGPGGHLEIRAVFADRQVLISHLEPPRLPGGDELNRCCFARYCNLISAL